MSPDKVTNDLLCEVLKDLQRRIGNVENCLGSLEMRMTSIDQRLGIVHTDIAGQSARIDNLGERIERVENRLGLNDPQQ